ncbi:MAG: hypothetical protein AVO33_10585 [delta proteobacterium ML8_F1]|nr:MAG: hypothetical protein AVO33_10585 [delta proteobacterium ML8_F1]
MDKKRIYMESLGCSKNQVDAEQMLGILSSDYDFTTIQEEADYIIVNTCAFIHDAKVESVDAIIAAVGNPRAGVIVTGCLAQRYQAELLEAIPEVRAFVGTTQFLEIAEVIRRLERGEGPIVETGDIDRVFPPQVPRKTLSPPYYAYVKIAEGCDNRCTYCIIPQLRGRYRSRPLEEILKEVGELVSSGVREIILIAQDTSRYGLDLNRGYGLLELLQALDSVASLKWIRIQYMYPDILDRRLIEGISRLEKVVQYFDIPIQHSSDRILKKMNRHTSQAQIIRVYDMIRELMPGAVIRTTVMVGFPGETEEDFGGLYEFIQAHPFDRLGAFKYSDEEGTPAHKLGDKVPGETALKRYERLMARQSEISERLLSRWLDRTLVCVVDEVAPTQEETTYIGRTPYDTPEVDGVVYISSDTALKPGDFVTVRITDHMEYDLIGVRINEPA